MNLHPETPLELLETCPEPDPDYHIKPEPYNAFGSDFDDTGPTGVEEGNEPTPFTVLRAGELLQRELPERVSVWGKTSRVGLNEAVSLSDLAWSTTLV